MHPTKLLVVSQAHLFLLFSLFPPFLKSPPLLRSFNFPPAVAQNPPILIALILFQMVVAPFETLISVLMNAVTREFEYEADKFACELPTQSVDKDGKPEKDMATRLGNALITLHVKNLSTVWVDWL